MLSLIRVALVMVSLHSNRAVSKIPIYEIYTFYMIVSVCCLIVTVSSLSFGEKKKKLLPIKLNSTVL